MSKSISEWIIRLIFNLKDASREKKLECKKNFESISEEDLMNLSVSVEANRDQCVTLADQLNDSITLSIKFSLIYKAFIWTVDQLLSTIKERDTDKITDSFLIFEQVQQKMLDILEEITIESKGY